MAKARLILSRIILIVYLAVVAFLCFGKIDNVPKIGPELFGFPTDKIVHFLMFFPFPMITVSSFRSIGGKWWQRLMSISGIFLCGCLIAAVTEVLQSFTDYRTADILDFRADVISLAISSLIVTIIDFIHTCSKK